MTIDTTYPPAGISIRQDGNMQVPAGCFIEMAPGASLVYDDTTIRSGTRKVVTLAGAADTGGGIGAWQNNTGAAVVVDRVIVDITTVATGACTLKAGTTNVSATTASANMINGVDVHTAAITSDNLTATTGASALQRLAAGAWLTFSTASGASAGLAGKAYISYFTP